MESPQRIPTLGLSSGVKNQEAGFTWKNILSKAFVTVISAVSTLRRKACYDFLEFQVFLLFYIPTYQFPGVKLGTKLLNPSVFKASSKYPSHVRKRNFGNPISSTYGVLTVSFIPQTPAEDMGEAQENLTWIFSAVQNFPHRELLVFHRRHPLIVLFPEIPLLKINEGQ